METWNDKWMVEWKRFLDGKWQLKMPQKAGNFPVKARNEVNDPEARFSFLIVYEDLVTHEHRSVTSWGGYWWSEPMPDEMPTLVRDSF